MFRNIVIAVIAILFFATVNLQAQDLKPVKSAPNAGKVVALTFDDGVRPEIHKEMLSILKKESVPVTFFLVGENLTEKKLIKKTIRAGHEIGNHSMSHPVLPDLSTEEISAEILDFQHILVNDYNYTPKVFRAPMLRYDNRVMEVLKQEKLVPINANVSTRDYAAETTEEYILQTAIQSGKPTPGSIILMHEVQKTANVLPAIIAFYKAEGYQFVTVSALLNTK